MVFHGETIIIVPMVNKQGFIYSDASFDKNLEVGIVGFALTTSKEEELKIDKIQFKSVFVTNNIRAELMACLFALESAEGFSNLTLYTDCQTICGLLARRLKLESNGFKSKSKNQQLANTDLYQEFYRFNDILNLKIEWVKGHSAKSGQSFIQKNFSVLDKSLRAHLRKSNLANTGFG